MRFLPLPRLLALLIILVAPTVARAASATKFQEIGNNTYSFTRTATSGLDRDVEKFRQEVREDATRYCAEKGKTMKVVALSSKRPHFGGGAAWASITFKAFAAGDPALTAPEAPALPPGMMAAPAGALPAYPGDMYSELLKLDDLRKRGILTDKEFEQQKKKLLKKSQ